MSFKKLGLDERICRALEEKGYKDITPIQALLIPAIFTKEDILAGAQTGTGKTAGFALPILHQLSLSLKPNQHYPKALVIVPTRELAKQVYEVFELYGKYLPLKHIVLYGGASLTTQQKRLQSGIDIIISTSGRLLEHLSKKNIDLKGLEYLVLDEADTILDMGFLEEISKIFYHLSSKKQTILTSATLSNRVKALSKEILTRPKLIEVDKMGTLAKNVTQVVYPVEVEKKAELLAFLIGSKNYQQVLVFVRKKEIADEVSEALNLWGLKTDVLHGGKSSGQRSRALSAFKEYKIKVLVATDITARGIDIPSLEVVINYDIPHVIGDYIHRVGRTGRAGKKGLALTLISPLEQVALRDVEKLIGEKIPKERLEGYAPLEETVQKGARKESKERKKISGAFGNKKKSNTPPKNKKRKTTKRDAFKVYEKPQKESSKRAKSSKRR